MVDDEDSQNLFRQIFKTILLCAIFLTSILLLATFQIPNNLKATDKILYTYDPKDVIESTLESHIEEKLILNKDYADDIATELMLQERIAKVRTFFDSYGAVMSGYEELIVRRAYECGGDYKVLVGIAGNESGLGRIPYKLYNPYGYLNNTQYSSWEESLGVLTCEISQRFLVPCNNDLYCIIRKYGGPETNQEKWIRNVSWFMSQV